jgi:alpha-pyrone synthase
MTEAYLNRVATAVPDHDIHQKFVGYAPYLLGDDRQRTLFRRMAERSQIEHRYSFLRPHANDDRLDGDDFYLPHDFPGTEKRMRFYERHALGLARRALDQLDLAARREDITHLIVTTCTGFYAPGIDLEVIEHYGLNPAVERTIVGFMGCYAAVNALKLARHIVRSEKGAQVLILNLELCTLHLQKTENLEQILSFLIFADGCAAALVSAEPVGMELRGFHAAIMPQSSNQITWHVGALGFDMVLSGRVPATIAAGLPGCMPRILDGGRAEDIRHWAIHPGGRTVLDAVEEGIGLDRESLRLSRDVLRRYGNMSSATVMFVLKEMLEAGTPAGRGCAMAFGPGLCAESMLFETAGG